MKRLAVGIITVAIVLLGGCTIIPGTYEFSQTYVPMGEMPPSKTVAITPAVIDELNAQDKEQKAALNKHAMLEEKRLADTTQCKGAASLDVYPNKAGRSPVSARGGQSSACDPREQMPDVYVYKLGVGDKLSINVWGNPDLNLVGSATAINMTTPSASGATRYVGPNGKLYFPFVGEVQAEGLTVNQFRVNLSKALSAYIKDPQIDVGVTSFQSQKVYLTGDVQKQGVYPITDVPLRITDLIGQAGLSPTADLYNVILTRNGRNTTLDLYDLYYEGKSGENVLLKHGDRVTVPDDKSRKLYVMGEVGASRSYMMRRGKMSLTEVLMDAGGINQLTSAPGRIYVLRADTDGSPIIYQLHAGQPEGFVLGDRFVMKPRDFVFVNPTDITIIGRVIGQLFTSFTPVATAATTGVGP